MRTKKFHTTISVCAVLSSVLLGACSSAGGGLGGPKVTEAVAQQYGFDTKIFQYGQCVDKKDWPDSTAKLSISDWLSCYPIPADQEKKEARLLRAQAITVAWAQYAALVIRPGDDNAKSDALSVIGYINESQKRIDDALNNTGDYKYLPSVQRAQYENGALNVMMMALRPTARKARGVVGRIAGMIVDSPASVLGGSVPYDELYDFMLTNRTVNTYVTAFRLDLANNLLAIGDGETNQEEHWAPLNSLLDKACAQLLVASGQEEMKCINRRPTKS